MNKQLDRLAKRLAGSLSRRGALRRLLIVPLPRAGSAGFDFDALATELAGGLSRRQALARLAGGVCASLLASLGLEPASGGPSKGCPSGQVSCAGSCVNLQTDPNNCGKCGQVCLGGASCAGGQ